MKARELKTRAFLLTILMVNDPNYLFEANAPEEVRKTLLQFLGQTYQEVSQYDNNLISANPFLSPKKHEFQRTAERVMQEALQSGPQQPPNHIPPQNQSHRQVVHPNTPSNQPPRPFLETGGVVAPSINDPDQMEFSFDNSVTAITINSKLEDLSKRMKILEKNISKVLDFIQSHEPKNIKQK